MHPTFRKKFATAAMFLGLACMSYAQDTPAAQPTDPQKTATPAATPAAAPAASPDAAPAAPAPLPTPSTSGPLQLALPTNLEAGKLGKYSINGAVSGIGGANEGAVSGVGAGGESLGSGARGRNSSPAERPHSQDCGLLRTTL